MAGFFSFLDVTKGRDRSDPTNPFVLFWFRYSKRFFHLIRVNLIFFLITLPFFVWIMTMYNNYVVEEGFKNIALMPALITYYLESIPTFVSVILVVLSAACSGPAWAGLTFVASRYAAGRHAWAWVDFRDAFRDNLKQAMPVGFAEGLFVFATFYYLMEGNTFFGAFGGIAKTIWFIFMFLYLLCRINLFHVMISVKLSMVQLIKNSLLIALIKPLRTFLCLIVIGVLIFACTFAGMVMLPLFAYSFFAFASCAVTFPVLKKYMLDPARQKQNAQRDTLQKEN